MSTTNMIDMNGLEIEMGEEVNMPEPNKERGDSWSNEFTGSIIEVDEDADLITVSDQDGECHSVEPNRVELV